MPPQGLPPQLEAMIAQRIVEVARQLTESRPVDTTDGDRSKVAILETERKNRQDAMARLNALVQGVARPPRVRKATRPTLASKQRRLEGKSQRAQVKALRGKVQD